MRGPAIAPLESFAALVGPAGPVTVAGGRTQWSLGGGPEPGTREVRAPGGVVSHQPEEMVVRVRAATTLAELALATAEGGQLAALESPFPCEATVGGVLSAGVSGVRRLGWGPLRDSVLEVTAVDSGGSLVRAGAPLVKNVTGFDLCRLLVGSLGTLALLAEVVLRCRPLPEVEKWWRGVGVDPFEVHEKLYRPLSVLWDGSSTWVGLAGYRADVADQKDRVLGPAFEEVAGPPTPPAGGRWSLPPAALRSLAAGTGAAQPPPPGWLAEVGVGVVHVPSSAPPAPPGAGPPEAGVVALHRRLKERFDPAGRLNPGRSPLRGAPA